MTATIDLRLGDCLEILTTLDTGSVDAVITDPPYGMDWNTKHSRFKPGPNGYGGQGTNTDFAPIVGDATPFDPTPWLDFQRVVFFGYHHFASRLPVGTVLVWIKRNDSAFGSFLSDAELAWMKGGHGVYCHRDMSIYGESRNKVHPTQKPVEIMKWCMDKAKIPIGATVLDPYMGSGTTGVACVQTGRNFIGIEIEPRYFGIAQRRINQAIQMVMPV